MARHPHVIAPPEKRKKKPIIETDYSGVTTSYKWVSFWEEKVIEKRMTPIWRCDSTSEHAGFRPLGQVRWQNGFMQFCFYTANRALLSVYHLSEIQEFLKQVNDTRRASRRKPRPEKIR